MIVGITALVLILCNGIILGKPQPGIEIGLDIGYFVAILATLGMGVAGYVRQAIYTDARKPPGVLWRPQRWRLARPAALTPPERRAAAGPEPGARARAHHRVRGTGVRALDRPRREESADGAAVDAMRMMLDSVSMDGTVVIGEGEKDEAPMLYNGERIGDGSPPQVDIAVDPLEGTDLCAKGMPSAIATIALAGCGTMFDPGPCVYMLKMATSRDLALLDLDRPLGETLKLMANEKGCDVTDIVVIMLDRPRHEDAMKEIREVGARIRLIPHGDVSASLSAVTEGRDRSALGHRRHAGGRARHRRSSARPGQIIGRLWPRSDEERDAALEAGYDLDEVLDKDRLVSGENVFFAATGVTEGDMLQGVHFHGGNAYTSRSACARARHGPHRHRQARPLEAARHHRGLAPRASVAVANAPTTDGSRSSRASERRKACVTITWMRIWVNE